MKQVSKETFYSYVNPRDICVTSRGYDYSRFETRQRVEVGRVYSLEDGVRKWYLSNEAINELSKEVKL